MGSGLGEQYSLSNLKENRETKLRDGNAICNNDKDEARIISSLYDNSKKLIDKYKLDQFGRFGEQGKNCRIIKCENPLSEGEFFFNTLTKGGKEKPLGNNPYGRIVKLPDNSLISYRKITKTPNSPAVEIIISGTDKIATQKIHFIKR